MTATVAETVELLGLPDMDEDELVARVRKGLPVKSVKKLGDVLEVQSNVLLGVLAMSEATLRRRRAKAPRRLLPDESDRLVRLTRVVAMAQDVLGDRDRARAWLLRPNRALGDQRPLSLLDTDLGVRQVETVLARIDYGIPS